MWKGLLCRCHCQGRHKRAEFVGGDRHPKSPESGLVKTSRWPHRLICPQAAPKLTKLPDDIWLLDETYNAGAEAVVASLQLLAAQPGTRRIAVLGTMKELGDQSIALHRHVGETVAALNLDELLILADPDEAKAMAMGAGSVATQTFEGLEPLTMYIKEQMRAGDRILFKASRSVAMDKVVDQLLKDFKIAT